MSNSIKYDNTEILTSSYIPRFVKHESATERELSFLSLARDDGSVLINDRRGMKTIQLQGILTATTQALLEVAIDSFKELFSRQQKNLDLSWGGSTRRYVATCKSHDFNRDHFHLKFVPWTAEFVVFSGVGEDLTETVIVNEETFSANYKTKAITLLGSAEPKIRFDIDINDVVGIVRGVELKNTDNGERIVVTQSSSLHEANIEFDTRLKTAKINGVEVAYYGIFPNFVVGTNNIQITLGSIIDQQFAPTGNDSNNSVLAGTKLAQGFMVPYTDITYRSIFLELSYTGDPSVGLSVRIETDNAGEPSGTLVDANAKGVISKAEMASGTSPAWYEITFDNFFQLMSNTRYWIVLEPFAPGLDSDNRYNWYLRRGVNATYKKGDLATWATGIGWLTNSNEDHKFKLCYGGVFEGFNHKYSINQVKRYL